MYLIESWKNTAFKEKEKFIRYWSTKLLTYTTFCYFATFVGLIISAISEFWNQFLFEESNICTNDIYTCCYDANQYYPQRLDCSNSSYLKTNNVTSIICYKFAFRLGRATGSTLGLVTSCVLGLLIITWCLLKISKGTRAKTWRVALTKSMFYC